MIDKIEINKEYWFFNTSLPTHLPKIVTPLSQRGEVTIFDDYIQNEKYAQTSVVRKSLFETESEALKEFVDCVFNKGFIHFVSDEDMSKLQKEQPEYFL